MQDWTCKAHQVYDDTIHFVWRVVHRKLFMFIMFTRILTIECTEPLALQPPPRGRRRRPDERRRGP
jgi:hypothetical protein